MKDEFGETIFLFCVVGRYAKKDITPYLVSPVIAVGVIITDLLIHPAT